MSDKQQNGDASNSSAAASLVHQTNANGVQQAILSPTPAVMPIFRPTISELLLRWCCCFSAADLQIQQNIRAASSRKAEAVPLLPGTVQEDANKICLVLDLDETLVHSSFKPVPNPDYVLPVEIEGQVHHIYVLKRPGVDEFLEKVGPLFEIAVYTASLSKYVSSFSKIALLCIIVFDWFDFDHAL